MLQLTIREIVKSDIEISKKISISVSTIEMIREYVQKPIGEDHASLVNKINKIRTNTDALKTDIEAK